MTDGPSLVAALGPTNTGKTYRALQRMRQHRTGMIGVPLRLLAREIYDRLSAELGELHVALVTGEEKRVPASPRFWICTVEAMPLDLEVDFLAIDEIQLATHRERGHVFTDRLLHARGRKETWFLGSATMTEMIRRLVPAAEIQGFPRLSELRCAGSYTLGSLGKRSAVVCFSASRVYEMAERLKARRGGAAIVLGALSPRARNAQVAMYESGEVDYLVATDAIGMGLNLDLDRVALADTQKFDGLTTRPLEIAELSQVAGRAGRHQKNGEFGVLAPEPRLPAAIEHAIETHQLHGERALVWRNHDLDFGSIDALLGSLEMKPPRPELQLVRQADDSATLKHLVRKPPIAERATSAERVELLWEVCRIPDYRKLLLEAHADLVQEIFVELVDRGRLSASFLEPRIRRIERGESDIETLMSRIAFTRTWTYVTFREGWVDSPSSWRDRTRALEDRLSDALHEALVARFVERKKKARAPAPVVETTSARAAPFAALADLKRRLEGEPAPPSASLRERAIDAPHAAFFLGADLKISFERVELARLVRGRRIREPDLRLLSTEEGAGLERRLERRLRAFLRDFSNEMFAPLDENTRLVHFHEPLSAAARGLFYRLEEGLGTIAAHEAEALVRELGEEERRAFEALGLVWGRGSLYFRSLLKPRALDARDVFWRVFTGAPRPPAWKSSTHATFALDRATPDHLLSLGFIALGPRAVRVDVVEKLLEAAARLDAPSSPLEPGATSNPTDGNERRRDWLQTVCALSGASKKEAPRVARAIAGLPLRASAPTLGP